jgi:hypothetical protein
LISSALEIIRQFLIRKIQKKKCKKLFTCTSKSAQPLGSMTNACFDIHLEGRSNTSNSMSQDSTTACWYKAKMSDCLLQRVELQQEKW